jgi:methionyl-tRNA formyltransferase
LNTALNIVFAGTPDFAARHLQALIDSQHNVIAVYSQPDRPAGRGKHMQASAVKQLAAKANIPVMQPLSLKTDEAQQQLRELNPDIMVVVAYGLILPKVVLEIPKLGCLNVHGSLLPRWRGAAPIQRALWAGDQETGVTIMQMDVGLDTGAMLLKKAIPIKADDTSASLYDKLANVGPLALLETLDKLDEVTAQNQDEQFASYAQKLSKEEAKVDWQLDAEQLARNVRAFNPWPVAYCNAAGNDIKIWQARAVAVADADQEPGPGRILSADKSGILVMTGQNALLLTSIQLPGKKALSAAEVLNGRADWFAVGSILS